MSKKIHLARGGEADFCGLCFGEREREKGVKPMSCLGHLNDSWLKSPSENYKIASALFGIKPKESDTTLIFFLSSSCPVIEYAIMHPTPPYFILEVFAQSWNCHNL